ncbi:MAG: hypothetical protein P3W94_007865 [Paracoccus sp. (in: a-proteobacteria)]|nr:hypothetical protein [Paracoccus sp. (in: a-proteobacteria)]
MIQKILMLLVPLVALLGGAFAGDMLRPAPLAATDAEQAVASAPVDQPPTSEAEWFTFPTQFFVPLVRRGDMSAIMILTLVLETDKGQAAAIERQEHRLRDALLRQLMIHANTGGFDGNYTVDRNVQALRKDLLNAARSVTDVPIRAVLIQDLARQDG